MIGGVDGFDVEFRADGRDVLVRVAGEVDTATAPTMLAQLDRARDGFSGDVRVDLADVTFFDSAAVCALLRARGGLAERGRRLVVAKTAPTARRVFELTGLLGVFQPDGDTERD
jgi:anti-sigma B factor antagonist